MRYDKQELHLIGMQKSSTVLDNMDTLSAIIKATEEEAPARSIHSMLIDGCTDSFYWGYIQGKRAERAKKHKDT